MSELETQKEETKKELTFEEICPTWSRRIANYDELSEAEKIEIIQQLSYPDKCFMGEARGFEYGFSKCLDCCDFGLYYSDKSLVSEFSLSKKLNWNKFNLKKEAFVKHWNEKHNG